MNLKPALKSNRTCEALTGLTVWEFKNLIWQFEPVYKEEKIKSKKDRKIKYGSGRISNLGTIEEKLFAILFYLKNYPTFDVLGFFLGLDRSNSFRNTRFLIHVLEITLKRRLVLPKRKITSVEEFIKLHPQVKDIFLDGTERRIQRPRNKKRQNKLYSGKKKTTTRKNIIISSEKKEILYLTPTKSGRRHDKRLLDKYGVENIPKEVTAWVDTGFSGLERIHTNTQIPKKKPKGGKLTQAEKDNNKIISGIRVVGEHAISGIKRLSCVTHVYRNKLINLDDTFMLLASGIWNYHLSFK
jgi:hypothetical protein